jgi:hypothetical protein
MKCRGRLSGYHRLYNCVSIFFFCFSIWRWTNFLSSFTSDKTNYWVYFVYLSGAAQPLPYFEHEREGVILSFDLSLINLNTIHWFGGFYSQSQPMHQPNRGFMPVAWRQFFCPINKKTFDYYLFVCFSLQRDCAPLCCFLPCFHLKAKLDWPHISIGNKWGLIIR